MVSNSTNYATRTFTVPAGGSVEQVRNAQFITVLEASAPFRITFDNGPASDIEQGITLRTVAEFSRIEIINPTSDPLAVKIGLGRGEVQDARLVISGAVNSKNLSPGVLNSGAPVACANAAVTQLAAADVNRRELILIHDNDATGPVYVGGAVGAGAGEGLPIQPGQSLTLETASAVFCRNDTGTAVEVAVAEMRWI